MRHGIAAIWLLCGAVWAQDWSDAVKQVTAKLLAQAPAHSTVSLLFENRSSLRSADADAVRRAVDDALRAGGVEVGESDSKLRVWTRESAATYVLVAQFGMQPAAIGAWSKPARSVTEYRMSIKRAAVREQAEPVLDVLLSSGSMLVLEPERVLQYMKKDGQWQAERSIALTLARPAPRDARGRIEGSATGFQISMPGTVCTGTAAPAFKVTCGASDPMHWVAGRNYFDTAGRGRYYTAAESGGGTFVAAIDGKTRVFGAAPEAVLTIPDWGSDIADIASDCGSKRQIIATRPGGETNQDSLQAFEFVNGAVVAVSEPLFVLGPVTALWRSESSGEVTAVVHNKRTGAYEASRISVGCAE